MSAERDLTHEHAWTDADAERMIAVCRHYLWATTWAGEYRAEIPRGYESGKNRTRLQKVRRERKVARELISSLISQGGVRGALQ